MAELEAAGDAPGKSPSCPGEGKVLGILDDVEKGNLPRAILSALPALKAPLARSLACRAFAAGDPRACERLELLDPEAAYLCRRDVRLWVFDRARIEGRADAFEACLTENAERKSGDESPFKDESIKEACAIIARDARAEDGHRSACRELPPHFREPTTSRRCFEILRYGYGEDESLCARQSSRYRAERCRDLALYRAARKRGTISACRGSVYCRALMGEGAEACRSWEEEARRIFCLRASPDYRKRLRESLLTARE